MNFSPFSCPIFLGHSKAMAAASKASGCFIGGEPNSVRAELGKQKPRSCRTQELARSRAQEKCAAEKGRLLELSENQSCGAKPLCCRKRRNLFG